MRPGAVQKNEAFYLNNKKKRLKIKNSKTIIKKCIKYIPQKSKFKLVGDLNFSLSKKDEKVL
jgi:hypothetical protein